MVGRILHVAGAGPVTVNLALPSANRGADAAGDSYASVEGIIGSGFGDVSFKSRLVIFDFDLRKWCRIVFGGKLFS